MNQIESRTPNTTKIFQMNYQVTEMRWKLKINIWLLQFSSICSVWALKHFQVSTECCFLLKWIFRSKFNLFMYCSVPSNVLMLPVFLWRILLVENTCSSHSPKDSSTEKTPSKLSEKCPPVWMTVCEGGQALGKQA